MRTLPLFSVRFNCVLRTLLVGVLSVAATSLHAIRTSAPVTSCGAALNEPLAGGHGAIEKVLLPGGILAARKTARPGTEAMLQREITNLRMLSTQNNVPEAIPRFIAEELGADGKPALLREWVEGQTFDERHIDPKNLTQQNFKSEAKEFLGHMKELFEAMKWMHQQGLYHLDIKGINLMLTNENKLKVIDFGVSVHGDQEPLGYTEKSSAPEVEVAMEDPAYTSELSAKSDYFSFGQLLKGWRSRITNSASYKMSREVLEAAIEIDYLGVQLTDAMPGKRLTAKQIEESLQRIERAVNQLP